jgi:hypothetical protein
MWYFVQKLRRCLHEFDGWIAGLPPQQATNEWLRTQLLMCSAAAVKATLLTSHWVPGKSWWEIDCEPCLGLAGCPSVIISWAAARGPYSVLLNSNVPPLPTGQHTRMLHCCLPKLATTEMGVWSSGRIYASQQNMSKVLIVTGFLAMIGKIKDKIFRMSYVTLCIL